MNREKHTEHDLEGCSNAKRKQSRFRTTIILCWLGPVSAELSFDRKSRFSLLSNGFLSLGLFQSLRFRNPSRGSPDA